MQKRLEARVLRYENVHKVVRFFMSKGEVKEGIYPRTGTKV